MTEFTNIDTCEDFPNFTSNYNKNTCAGCFPIFQANQQAHSCLTQTQTNSSILKEEITKEITKEKVTENDEICAICLNEFDDENINEITICGHKFHKECFDECLKKCNKCPMCRKVLIVENKTTEQLFNIFNDIPRHYNIFYNNNNLSYNLNFTNDDEEDDEDDDETIPELIPNIDTEMYEDEEGGFYQID